jgi:paired amphipathic helix protein Sin3a
MYYIVGSEDIFVRPHSNNASPSNNDKWNQWVESPTTGWSKDLDEATRKAVEQEVRNSLMQRANEN